MTREQQKDPGSILLFFRHESTLSHAEKQRWESVNIELEKSFLRTCGLGYFGVIGGKWPESIYIEGEEKVEEGEVYFFSNTTHMQAVNSSEPVTHELLQKAKGGIGEYFNSKGCPVEVMYNVEGQVAYSIDMRNKTLKDFDPK